MPEQPAHPSVAERPPPAFAGSMVPGESPADVPVVDADGLAVLPGDGVTLEPGADGAGALDHPAADEPAAVADEPPAVAHGSAADTPGSADVREPAGGSATGEEPERSPPTREEAVAAAMAGWRVALSSSGRADGLLAGSGPDGARIDLTSAHPSGLAQLLAGRPTRLSSLVREPAAHAAARRSARMIRSAATVLAAERGVRGCFLAAGQVSWTGGESPFSAPVLLRGCTVRPRGSAPDDYDLDLDDGAVINAEVLRGIATGCGVLVDGAELGELAFGQRGFDPRPVYEWLEERCRGLTGFRIERSLVVATFTAGSGAVLADLDAAADAIPGHDLLSRIALREAAGASGDATVPADGAEPGSAVVLAASARPALLPGGREVDEEPRPLDLDPAQRAAVEAVARGGHVAIEGPPGTGATQTLVAAAAALVAAGRRVLVLCPRRVTADSFLARLDAAGLAGLALDVRDGEDGRAEVLADLLAGLDSAAEEAEAAETDDDSDVDAPPAYRITGLASGPGAGGATRRRPDGAAAEALPAQPVRSIRPRLLQARDRLAGASVALHASRTPWGVSAYDAMVALTELMARPNPPRTRVRLPEPVLTRLDTTTRERMRTHLHLAAAAGGFSLSTVETRWFDARIGTDAEARRALAAAQEARDGLPEAAERMAAVAAAAGLAAPGTVAGWRPLLELLFGVRETLDVMLPAVYEQPLDDLIEATGRSGPLRRGDAGWLERIRRRRRAAALVRPGVYMRDLHTVLVTAARQRARWLELTDGTGWPAVPTGLDQAWVAVDRIEAALEVLAGVFSGPAAQDPTAMPLPSLERRLDDLAGDVEGVRGQPRRTTLLRGLEEAGLGPLVEDLRARRAGEGDVDGELDLAWWRGVLESIVSGDARLARHDGAALWAAAADLRDGEHEEIARAARQTRITVAGRAVRAAAQYPDQMRWLREAAASDPGVSWPADLFTSARDVVSAARPIWVMSPDAVARGLPVARPGTPCEVDAVLVDDAGNVGLAEAVAALSRAECVVAAGDRRGLPAPEGAESVLAAVCSAAGVYRLDTSHRARDARLVDPVRHRYDQRWDAPPGAVKEPCLRLQVVREGVAVPAPGEDLAVSSDAEVRRVVDLVVEHATLRPRESLMVVTLGERHAERVEAALRAAAPGRAMLRRWLEDAPNPGEPLVVRPATRVLGLERDAVIVSIGLARTPHGRLLHRFGVLDGPGGAGCLTTAMSRARLRTTVVSCFTAEDLLPERLRTEGARLLHDVLEIADGAPARHASPRPDAEPDPLLADLGDRLATAGMPVHLGVGDPEWPIDIALSDPQAPGTMLLAVELDTPRYASRGIRERDRQRPERLEGAGWAYCRVFALDVFRDPAAEVDRIRRAWIRAMLDQEGKIAVAELDQERRREPGAQTSGQANPVLPEPAADDTGWGEWPAPDDDERLLRERPPHWE